MHEAPDLSSKEVPESKMGLLTDPSAGRGKITELLVKYYNKLCILLYVIGLVWFLLLAHGQFDAGTYFSENALLPGLVRGEFSEDVIAKQYHADLLNEAARYPDSIPYSWLVAKFRQLSLDTFQHNFTLNYPLGQGTVYTGKNIYAILRAPRSASTEALVLSVPYRPPSSMHPGTLPSVALMLALAKFFRHQKYWAKDIIFLVTDHEQLGMQAWLEAYHQATCGRSGVLNHGDLVGRGGAIQAAINLEIHAEKVSHIDVKIEGLNGQLPNLDLVNLVHRMCAKEGVRHTFKNRDNPNYDRILSPYSEWAHKLQTLMTMVCTQATGVPTGNHGLFHRFGIEAVTLEGFKKTGRGSPALYYQLGRVIEGLFRSMNNLLERFHQSYFFYLQPATDRYISIGMYMPPLGFICAALFIKAFGSWLQMQEDPSVHVQSNEKKENKNFSLVPVGITVLTTHICGVALLSAAGPFTNIGSHIGDLGTDTSIFVGYFAASFILIILPVLFCKYVDDSGESWVLLNIVGLLEMGTLFLAVAMHNFSLALLTSAVYVIPAISTKPARNTFLRALQKIVWLTLHPLSLLTVIIAIFTYVMFPDESYGELLIRSFTATKQALVFAIVDSYIYGNWLFSVATAVMVPNWLLFWFGLFSSNQSAKAKLD